jgi:hypothetical protein
MKKEPAVTLHNNYINLRQEHRDKISAQTKEFINNGGKVDEKPMSWSYNDENSNKHNPFNRSKI